MAVVSTQVVHNWNDEGSSPFGGTRGENMNILDKLKNGAIITDDPYFGHRIRETSGIETPISPGVVRKLLGNGTIEVLDQGDDFVDYCLKG